MCRLLVLIDVDPCVPTVEEIEFTEPLTDVKITKLGETAVFECEASKANARYQWLKDGHEIYPDAKYTMSCDGHRYRLEVQRVDSQDNGDYALVIKGHRYDCHAH